MGVLGYLNVKDFGAKGDGSTDDTSAMTAAHASGKIVYYPQGSYKFSTLSMPKGGGIVGDGMSYLADGTTWIPGCTQLMSTSTGTSDIITFTFNTAENDNCYFANFGLITASSSGTQKTGGYAINCVNAQDWDILYAVFDNVAIRYMVNGIKMYSNMPYFSMTRCRFYGLSGIAVHVENNLHPDSGDSSIMNCSFVNCGTGVQQYSSGGLRIINNKFDQGSYGYQWVGQSGVQTTNLLCHGNSFENYSTAAIDFKNTVNSSGNTTFGHITISGNEIALSPRAIYFEPIANYTTGPGCYWDNIAVTGNVFDGPGANGPNLVEYNTARYIAHAGNSFICPDGTTTALRFGAGCDEAIISDFFGYFGTTVSAAKTGTPAGGNLAVVAGTPL